MSQRPGAGRIVDSTPPAKPSWQRRLLTDQPTPPIMVGVLATGFYGLLFAIYAVYEVVFQWDQLAVSQTSVDNAPYATFFLAALLWPIASVLFVAGFTALGMTGRWAIGLAGAQVALVVAIMLLLFSAIEDPRWQIAFVVDVGALFAVSIVLASVQRRWDAWIRGAGVAVVAAAFVALNALLLGGPAFAFLWLVGLLATATFVVAWLWARSASEAHRPTPSSA